MNKNFKYYLSIWAILFALFNVVVFIVPNISKFGNAFWTGYIFITLSFIGQLACGYFTLKAENLKKLFYNIPLIRISGTGLVLTWIFGTACMIIPNRLDWIGIIVCMTVLAFTAIAVIKTGFAGEVVQNIDKKIKNQTNFIKFLSVDAQNLLMYAKSDTVKTDCKRVLDKIRYSEPMSDERLTEIETEITNKFKQFADCIKNNKTENVATVSDELVILLDDRNNKCKVLK